ncbi:MAG TPA: ABC transporter substrate binding protein, partial [Pyrinomonadaceae bacterium]|nr:ABC transporter substrate binding protein [Pyrinomonadaceae bacterium]
YEGQKFDLIIAQAGSVLSFLTKYGEELFPGTPIVFGTLEKSRLEGLTLRPNITGVLADAGLGATLEAALNMQPDTRNVVVVSGSSGVDADYLAKARLQFRSFERRVEFTYLTGLPMEEFEKRLANLPEHSIIFYVTLFRDGAGQAFTVMDSVARIARAANAPTYSFIDRLIEAGSIGGFVLSVEADGREVAKVALRVLAGEKPADIPIRVADTNRYMFDWRQLRRWNIDERRVPPGSILLFRQPTFWELYKWRVVGVTSICVLQALLIVWLLITRHKRLRAEEANKSLAAIVESSDDAILSETLDGMIKSWNAGAERMYGYAAGEMVGQHVSILIPPELDQELPMILERVRRGENVDQLETVRVTKDGRRIDVSLTISAIKDERGIITGASAVARDITDHKRDQQKLHHLAGRLLMLQDEEQQRVAAELHDGLGQNLAIIRNRAVIGLRDQTSQEQAREQLEEIAATATASIVEVREIAHNLRPYELDRLGLVAAIESMIERVSDSTAIKLSASLDRIEGLLSPEAETSVYRIVQEGLNNVIKHSKATTARIEIKKNGNQLAIAVQDNGAGIPSSISERNGNKVRGFGLAGIAERVRVLGGSLAVDSRPSHGTAINIRLELTNGRRD